MEPITLKKPDQETKILFALAMLIIIAKCSSCSVVRTIVVPAAEFPLTVESIHLSHSSTGKLYYIGLVDRRNRIYGETTNVMFEPGHVFKTHEELIQQVDQLDRSTTFEAIKP